MFRNIYLILTIVFVSVMANAQELPFQSAIVVKYDVNAPMANRDFLNNNSFVGFEIEGKWKVAPSVTFGLGVNWVSYYQYESRSTYSAPGIDITTDLYKYVYTLPITANLQYHFTSSDKVIPYVGLGIGTVYTDRKLLFNAYQATNNNWGLAVRPEVGAAFFLSRESTTALHVAMRYSYYSNGNDTFGYNNFQSLGFQIGLNFTMYE